MSSLPRYAVISALIFSCAVFRTAADAQTTTPRKAMTNSVSGHITIHGKGTPGIIVSIRNTGFSAQPLPVLKATTDQDGNYRISDIPAGNYQVSPIAPTYVFPEPFSSRARGKMLMLAEGEEVQGIDFSLVRGGVIAGKVTDADGRPVIEELLTIVPEGQDNRNRQMSSPVFAGGFQTDDRGVYRIYGIPAGRYKIFVGAADEERFWRIAYKQTFYPDAAEAEDAKVIEVTEGSEATNIDITVGRSLPSFAASGKVVDGVTGDPVIGLRFGLRRLLKDGEDQVVGMFVASSSKGEFRLENIMPGKYVVFIAPQPGNEVRADGVPFEVIDQDVTGLLLKTFPGLTVTGTVVLEDAYDKNVLAKLAQLRLQAYVRDETNNSSWQESIINTDGSFRIGGLGPGTANFSLRAPDRSPVATFAIVRVERDGVVQRRGVELKAGERIGDIKIIVSHGTGSIRGEVKVENGPLPEGARIMIWMKKLDATEPTFRPYNVDSRGHFLIEGVTAGSYEVNVNATIPGRRVSPSTKQIVDVSEGTSSDISVTLDLKANPLEFPNP
jgi:hypothetical protein